ncbi:HAD family hydrolase [Bacillus sp. FJAT-27264]|uniref:HAD-IIB family hydrolase n=1 Tax=Paenibacillus sp. (strain DSM 101736 / FJAT-27264) TaxID=1850362 RepID=UPI002570139F|nr:HAD family hydrolase [Bacillus sp. FJAT-27264]
MLVLDIDGTSITDTYNVTDELQQVIHFIKKEHMVYIATGRSVSDAYRYYQAFNLKNDLICHNGGLIYNPNSGVVRYKNNICNAENIIEFLLKYQHEYNINNVVLSRCNETYLLTNENEYLHEIIINQDLPHFHIGHNLAQIHDVQRIIISISSDFREALQNEVVRLFENIIVCGWRGRDDIIDISVGSVNKWTAVKGIAEENEVMDQNIISFGDAFNDIELLKNSGIGICMINGVDEAKDVADYITEFDNNENGVYHFLMNQLSTIFNITQNEWRRGKEVNHGSY